MQNIKNSNEEALSMTKNHQWKMLNKYMKYGSPMYKLKCFFKKKKHNKSRIKDKKLKPR